MDTAPTTDFITMLFVFMLATFIGLGVIRRVSRLLHTPLMSLTNAISAIAVVGVDPAWPAARHPTFSTILGAIAVFASMTNIVSGFLHHRPDAEDVQEAGARQVMNTTRSSS